MTPLFCLVWVPYMKLICEFVRSIFFVYLQWYFFFTVIFGEVVFFLVLIVELLEKLAKDVLALDARADGTDDWQFLHRLNINRWWHLNLGFARLLSRWRYSLLRRLRSLNLLDLLRFLTKQFFICFWIPKHRRLHFAHFRIIASFHNFRISSLQNLLKF